jgi:PAS domain S-box-containing protein
MGWMLILLALLVLSGWAFHIPDLTSVVPGLATMKANTAAAFLLTGVALLRRNHRDGAVYALGVLVIGTITLLEFLLNSDFGIDQLLVRDPYSIEHGRMSQITGAGFMILGPALALMKSPSRTGRRISRALGVLVWALGFIALLGYSYDTQALYQVRPYSSVALHTALALVIAAIGVQCANPTEGIVSRIHAANAGGLMLRQLFPAALLVPYLLGLGIFVVEKQVGWATGFSLALLVASIVFCLVVIMMLNARRLEREDLARREMNRALEERTAQLQAGEELLKTFVKHAPAAVAMFDRDMRYLQVSDRWCADFSLDSSKTPGRWHYEILPDVPERWKEFHRRGLAGETLHVEEDRWDRADGRSIWVRWEIRPWGNREGLSEGILIFSEDITERKRTEEALEESKERLAGLVASAMDAIIAIDEEQRILLFNAAAEEIFGCPIAEAIGSSIDRFIPPRLRPAHSTHIRHFSETGVTNRAMTSLGALFGLRASGEEFPIEASISQVEVSGKKVFTVIIRDITERHRAELAVRESEERFRLVANTAPVLIWMSGPDGRCTYFNQPWLDFTGLPIETQLGDGWAQGVHSEDVRSCLGTYAYALGRRESFQMQYRLRNRDGVYRWVFDIGVPRFNSDGSFEGYIGSCIDVTERKMAEDALAELSGRLIEAQEEERKRVAREIHDDYNQRLALVAIDLERLAQRIGDVSVEAGQQLHELYNRVSELGCDLHSLSHSLHSSTLENLGLVAGVKALCEEFSEQQSMQVDFAHKNVPRGIPGDAALCIFRVAQEALRNIKRHSGANRAAVRLEWSDGKVHLAVSDRGKGFDAKEPLAKRGIGIRSMEERLRPLGGQLAVQSRPREGTRIDAWLPFQVAASQGVG